MKKEEEEEKKQGNHPEDDKNILEWIVFSLSLVLITAILGYLVYQTATYQSGSPDLGVSYVHDPSPHAPYRYFIRIRNDGQETAEEVQIELVLEKDGAELESAAMSIPYSPKKSTREGWVNFSKNPSDADTLYARVVSYKRP
jgi:uncharacterized protein (TIGR02588 family)